ncbi:uncharacterized [Tachysurus ichikawai]
MSLIRHLVSLFSMRFPEEIHVMTKWEENVMEAVMPCARGGAGLRAELCARAGERQHGRVTAVRSRGNRQAEKGSRTQ